MAVSLDRQPEKLCYAIMDTSILDYFLKHKTNYSALELIHGTGHPEHHQRLRLKDDAKSLTGSTRPPGSTAYVDDIESEVDGGPHRRLRHLRADRRGHRLRASRPSTGLSPTTTASASRATTTSSSKTKTYMLPLTKPPYYVLRPIRASTPRWAAFASTTDQQVVNKELHPIPGLYAAGVVAGGWLGRNYGFFGSEMSFVTYSGYAAGENAAAEIHG